MTSRSKSTNTQWLESSGIRRGVPLFFVITLHVLVFALLRAYGAGVTHEAHRGQVQRTILVRLLPLDKRVVYPPPASVIRDDAPLKATAPAHIATTAEKTQPARLGAVVPAQESGQPAQKESPKPTVVRMASIVVPPTAQDFAGAVTIELTVGVDGDLVQALILSSTPRGVYDNAVLTALAASEFRAGRNHLGPVVGTLRLQFDFSSGQVSQSQAP